MMKGHQAVVLEEIKKGCGVCELWKYEGAGCDGESGTCGRVTHDQKSNIIDQLSDIKINK